MSKAILEMDEIRARCEAGRSMRHDMRRNDQEFIQRLYEDIHALLDAVEEAQAIANRHVCAHWMDSDCDIQGHRKPEGIAIELADCIIRILDYCGHAGINTDEAMRIKHEYNKTRPYRHGGKRA